MYPHHLMSMITHVLQQRFSYWLRRTNPDQTAEATERIQATLHKIVEGALGNPIATGFTAYDQLYIPSRLKGIGLEEGQSLRHSTLLAGILDTLPALIDRAYTDDEDNSRFIPRIMGGTTRGSRRLRLTWMPAADFPWRRWPRKVIYGKGTQESAGRSN